jgi:cell fate regulator YaaT (PSP1 superfamily)
MGCSSCSSTNGVPAGCKSNGSCGTGGCNKLEVFDWLSDIAPPGDQTPFDLVEVRFKNSRKGFYHLKPGMKLQVGDVVVVDASPGYDVGVVAVAGELARIQVRKKSPNLRAHEAKKVYRKATADDITKWKTVREQENDAMFKSRQLATQLGLKMKLSDVEYQGDGTRATFYYTSEDRVDFRQLIKNMADTFRVRIEMKQIGMRQESARLGGIGSCGRELCCSTWLTDFRSVSTASARYQQLSLNPQKLAGQCGKLKCCLNYELDAYVEALKKFPSSDIKLKTDKGIAYHVKTDVFKEEMWYAMREQEAGESDNFIPLSPERVKEIIRMNKEGKTPPDLKEYATPQKRDVVVPDYTNVVGQDSLNRFEHVFKKKKKKKNRNKSKQGGQQGAANQSASGVGKQSGQGGQQRGNRPPKQQGKGGGQQPRKNQPQGSGAGKTQANQQANSQNQNRRRNKNRNRRKGPPGNKPQDKPAT